MGSIFGHRLDYNGVMGRGSERPTAHTHQLTQVPPPSPRVENTLVRQRNARVTLGAKTSEVLLCFLAIIFLGSIVLTSFWLLYTHCFTSLVIFAGFYSE